MLSIRKPPRKPPTWIAYSYNASKLHGNPPCGGFPGPKSGNPPPRLINDDTVG